MKNRYQNLAHSCVILAFVGAIGAALTEPMPPSNAPSPFQRCVESKGGATDINCEECAIYWGTEADAEGLTVMEIFNAG